MQMGGWSLDEAKLMMKWLSDRKAEYIEQPLVEGDEDKLKFLFEAGLFQSLLMNHVDFQKMWPSIISMLMV